MDDVRRKLVFSPLGFALLLAALHTLLIELVQWIDLNNAWNDQNATLLVALLISLIDAPLIAVLDGVIDRHDQPGSYLLSLKIVGACSWFAIGFAAAWVLRTLKAGIAGPQRSADSVC